MIKQPKQLARVYPTVAETYAAAGLGVLSVPEKQQQWAAGKSHKTHFASSKNASQSLPKTTNTPGLNDGSAQARAILGPTFEGDITIEGAGVRQHALAYLKGKDVPNMGQWTWNLIGDEPEVVNPPDPNEAFIETGREFLQQLRDKATSVEEVMVPFDLNPSPADTAARKIQERDELKTTS